MLTLVATAVVGADVPERLDGGAGFPDRARVETGQLRAHVAELRVGGVDVLAMTTSRVRPATGAAAGVVDGRGAGRAPRVVLGEVVGRADAGARADAVESAVLRLVVRPRLLAARAAVHAVRVRADRLVLNRAAVALRAADAAADGHPQARLADGAGGAPVPAGAGIVAVRLPFVRRLAAGPARVVDAVDGVAGLRRDQVGVGRRRPDQHRERRELHRGFWFLPRDVSARRCLRPDSHAFSQCSLNES